MVQLLVMAGCSLMAGLLFYTVVSKAIPSYGEIADFKFGFANRVQEARKRIQTPESRLVAERRRRAFLVDVVELIGRLVPSSSAESKRNRDWLVYSGIKMPASTFWAFRVGSIIAGAFTGIIVASRANDPGQASSLFLMCVVLGSQVPTYYVFSRRSAWRRELDRDLPDALDLMTVVVSAGSTLDVALRVVSERMKGSLAAAFADIVEEARFGSRSEALIRFAKRSEVGSLQLFAASLAQTESTGAPLVDILKEQAATVRTMRRMKIEERANALQVKMLLPMLGFIFPVLVVVLVAPLITVFLEAFA